MTQPLAARVNRIKPSATLAISAKANELKAMGKPIINLSVGEPDFDTPAHIKQAAIAAINQGFTKYTAVGGTPQLKDAICRKFRNENDLQYQTNQILVSCGAKHSIYNLLQATINPGDEVIIPAPYWVSYPDMVLLAEGEPVIVPTDMHDNFKMTAPKLAAAITPKTRMVILNSPSNPTGVAYGREELQALAQVLQKHPNILIVSDDIYEHIYWGKEPFANIVMACNELADRTILINGVSKSYSMTGWRIGYAAGPEAIITAMTNIQSQSTSNPTSIAQKAAEAALLGDQDCIRQMNKAFKERHDLCVSYLNNISGVNCQRADGAFYLFPHVAEAISRLRGINNDLDFSTYLLEQAHIAVVPGSAFGAPGYIRLSIALGIDTLETALKQMQQALEP